MEMYKYVYEYKGGGANIKNKLFKKSSAFPHKKQMAAHLVGGSRGKSSLVTALPLRLPSKIKAHKRIIVLQA